MKNSKTIERGYRQRLMFSYGLGDAGTGLAAAQLGFYLLPFFTCAASLPVWVGGVLLTVTKLWDAFNDPLIGWLSDHTRSRWGPRLPWIAIGAAPLGISLAAIWWVPPGGVFEKTFYYVFIVVLLMTAYTSVNLPYAALASELTTQTSIRTRLNAARFTGSIIASLTGLLVASLLTSKGTAGYIEMGRITGTIATLTTLCCCWGLAPFAKKAQQPKQKTEPLLNQLSRIIRNNYFIKVLSLYLLLWCGLQLMQTVALFYLVQVIRLPVTISTWLLLLFQISALAGLQTWSVYSNKHGRIKALNKGGGLWIGACILTMFLPPLSHQVNVFSLLDIASADGLKMLSLVACILLAGFGASTAYLIPWSLLPDAIDSDPDKPAGSYTAWMVLIQKILVALSVLLVTCLLWLAGYQSAPECTGAMTFADQPASAVLTIRLFMGLIPALLVAIGLRVMRHWPNQSKTVKVLVS
ncbi:MFS transporter [Prochlorococcus sp. MIT 1307]|uniref:MFS transporter n=1 Tax=Prochlorococcus sp. MIT 1307 TaxID=3096219 RepID=UPI0039BF42FA